MATETSKKPCILVAEGDPDQRESLLDMMGLCCYEMIQVKDGNEAIEKLHDPEKVFSLVMLDVNLPEKDGQKVLSVVHEDEKLKDVPVIMLYPYENEDVAKSCMEHGANEMIMKPVRMYDAKTWIKYVRKGDCGKKPESKM
mmetsp:Transcript_13746/g.15212  ORF Transcript_13746/g.15212 Transcript_13746/m.15212 type:complete len:141 (+) Transcript_13746:39-461(+)